MENTTAKIIEQKEEKIQEYKKLLIEIKRRYAKGLGLKAMMPDIKKMIDK